jgi:hypothetical protein
MQNVGQLLKTSDDSRLSALSELVKTLQPELLVEQKTLDALNKALQELEIKGGEVKSITRGEVWRFQDAYKYLYHCTWHCVSLKSCKYKGIGAQAQVIDGKLKFDYVGCGRFFAMRRAFRWITQKDNKEILKEARGLGKDLEDFTLEEWRVVLGKKWADVVSGKLDE